MFLNEYTVQWILTQTNYTLSIYHLGSDNTTTVSNLLPYTLYQISITACTAADCNTSVATGLRTGEYTPEGLSTPVAGLIEARQIAFTWGIPTKPNGVIIRYKINNNLDCVQTLKALYKNNTRFRLLGQISRTSRLYI